MPVARGAAHHRPISFKLIVVYERYQNYSPPRWIRPTLERLLMSVPEAYGRGLAAVVLTNSEASEAHRKRPRARRNRRHDAFGSYVYAWNDEPAWIELVVDRIVEDLHPRLRWVQPFRDLLLGRVLFHEIGHHLEKTIGAEARSGEPAARRGSLGFQEGTS